MPCVYNNQNQVGHYPHPHSGPFGWQPPSTIPAIETKTPGFMCFIKETAAEDWRISIN